MGEYMRVQWPAGRMMSGDAMGAMLALVFLAQMFACTNVKHGSVTTACCMTPPTKRPRRPASQPTAPWQLATHLHAVQKCVADDHEPKDYA